MSGRRRRDDEWGDGRLDAQDDRRDPWADDSVGEWGSHDTLMDQAGLYAELYSLQARSYS